jgi:hypothetical protein
MAAHRVKTGVFVALRAVVVSGVAAVADRFHAQGL